MPPLKKYTFTHVKYEVQIIIMTYTERDAQNILERTAKGPQYYKLTRIGDQ